MGAGPVEDRGELELATPNGAKCLWKSSKCFCVSLPALAVGAERTRESGGVGSPVSTHCAWSYPGQLSEAGQPHLG